MKAAPSSGAGDALPLSPVATTIATPHTDSRTPVLRRFEGRALP